MILFKTNSKINLIFIKNNRLDLNKIKKWHFFFKLNLASRFVFGIIRIPLSIFDFILFRFILFRLISIKSGLNRLIDRFNFKSSTYFNNMQQSAFNSCTVDSVFHQTGQTGSPGLVLHFSFCNLIVHLNYWTQRNSLSILWRNSLFAREGFYYKQSLFNCWDKIKRTNSAVKENQSWVAGWVENENRNGNRKVFARAFTFFLKIPSLFSLYIHFTHSLIYFQYSLWFIVKVVHTYAVNIFINIYIIYKIHFDELRNW
jgi:hypothetical protein